MYSNPCVCRLRFNRSKLKCQPWTMDNQSDRKSEHKQQKKEVQTHQPSETMNFLPNRLSHFLITYLYRHYHHQFGRRNEENTKTKSYGSSFLIIHHSYVFRKSFPTQFEKRLRSGITISRPNEHTIFDCYHIVIVLLFFAIHGPTRMS